MYLPLPIRAPWEKLLTSERLFLMCKMKLSLGLKELSVLHKELNKCSLPAPLIPPGLGGPPARTSLGQQKLDPRAPQASVKLAHCVLSVASRWWGGSCEQK